MAGIWRSRQHYGELVASIINAISIAPGTAGQVLTSNGAATPASFQAVSGSSVYFRAYVNVGIANVTGDGTIYQIIPNATQFNVGGGFNAGTGEFTAPSSGKYLLTLNTFLQAVNNALFTQGHTFIQINGAINTNPALFYNPFSAGSASGDFLTSASDIVQLTAGDVIRYFVTVSGGPKTVIIAGQNPAVGWTTTVGGALIGP